MMPIYRRNCGNCWHGVVPEDGMYSDSEVCWCHHLKDFTKVQWSAEKLGCEWWEWNCVGESWQESYEEAMERIHGKDATL